MRSTPARTVTIRGNGQKIEVHPDVPELRILRTRRVTHMTTAPDVVGHHEVDQFSTFVNVDGQLTLELPAGLLYAVLLVLSDAGYGIQVSPHSIWPSNLPPILANSTNSAGGYQPFFDFIARYECGVLELVPGASIEDYASALVTAYPQQQIAFVGPRIAENRKLARMLRRVTPDVGAFTGSDWPDEIPRVICSTYYGLTTLDLHLIDIIVVLDGVSALGERGRLALAYADRARLYGVMSSHERLSPFDRDQMTELFGFARLRLLPPGQWTRDVEVVWQRIGGGVPLMPSLEITALKRRAIWHHPVRNRRLAAAAREAVADTAMPRTQQGLGARNQANVVVLVENIEHAMRIRQELPDWPVLRGNESKLPPRLAACAGDAGVIATFDVVRAADFTDVDVLVRADGGTGLPPPRFIAISNYQNAPLRIIDFDDHHHPQLRIWSRQRREQYVAAGWYAPGADPVTERVRQYLASRPGVVV